MAYLHGILIPQLCFERHLTTCYFKTGAWFSLNLLAVGISKAYCMLKQKTKLVFNTIQDLWHYAQRINAINIEINTRERSLVCDCHELELAIALDEFNATIANQYAHASGKSMNTWL